MKKRSKTLDIEFRRFVKVFFREFLRLLNHRELTKEEVLRFVAKFEEISLIEDPTYRVRDGDQVIRERVN